VVNRELRRGSAVDAASALSGHDALYVLGRMRTLTAHPTRTPSRQVLFVLAGVGQVEAARAITAAFRVTVPIPLGARGPAQLLSLGVLGHVTALSRKERVLVLVVVCPAALPHRIAVTLFVATRLILLARNAPAARD
jgi:hypothetical protein